MVDSSTIPYLRLNLVIMGIKELFLNSAVAKNVRALKSMPREVCLNSSLLLAALFYSQAAITVSK